MKGHKGWRLLIAISLLALSCASGKPTSQIIEDRFLERISTKDWRGIFAMASPEERQLCGLDQEQYVRLMDIVTEGFPKNLGCKTFARFKARDTSKSFACQLTQLPKFGPEVKVPTGYLALELKMAKGQWYPLVSTLPFQLLAFQQETNEKQRQRLLRAMEESRIPWLLNPDTGGKLRVEDQRLVVSGKLAPMEAFR